MEEDWVLEVWRVMEVEFHPGIWVAFGYDLNSDDPETGRQAFNTDYRILRAMGIPIRLVTE